MTYNYKQDIKQFEKKHPNLKYKFGGKKYKIELKSR